jgi:hypothetical protein
VIRHEGRACWLCNAAVIAGLAVLLFSAFGCVPYAEQQHLPKKPGQETAELIIQQEMAQHFAWKIPAQWQMPEVEWVEGGALTCYGEGWYTYYARNRANGCDLGAPVETSPKEGPGITTGGPACKVCLLGLSLINENKIESNWSETLPAYHQKSLTHEYCHFFSAWVTGSSDSTHVGPCYVKGGYVDLTKKSLEEAGL